jgi:ribosomal protein S18 acetylase RimI-like enzyme
MELVKCTLEYWEFIRLLRTDERVVDGFVENVQITPPQQQAYMEKYSDSYRIALFNGEPAGFVGVVDDDIRVCTHPNFQGKGLGKFMIDECMKIWPNSTAKVKLGNVVSDKLFLSVGFEEFKRNENFTYYKRK